MKKASLLLLMCIVLSCCLTSFDEAYGAKYKCYKLYWNDYCMDDGNYNYLTWNFNYVAIYTDPMGLYYDFAVETYGTWNLWKGTFTVLYDSAYGTFMSGSKKKGHYIYSNGTWHVQNRTPGCYYFKKVNCKTIVTASSLDNIEPRKDGTKKPSCCFPQ